jgi:hypothetical protein
MCVFGHTIKVQPDQLEHVTCVSISHAQWTSAKPWSPDILQELHF